MKKRVDVLLAAALAVIDAGMINLAFFLSYRLRFQVDIAPSLQVPSAGRLVLIAVLATIVMLLTMRAQGLYHLKRGASRVDESYSVLRALSIGIILVLAVSAILRFTSFSALMVVYAWLFAVVLIVVARAVFAQLRSLLHGLGVGEHRVLIVGTEDVAYMIFRRILQNPELGYRVVGFLQEEGDALVADDLPVLGTTEELRAVVREEGVDEVIIALSRASHQRILDIVTLCEDEATNIRVYPDAFQIITKNEVSIGDLNGLPMVSVREVAIRGWKRVEKRLMDFVVSAVVLILLSPVMLLCAVLIKLTSSGPAFYVQERVGLDGKSIHVLKFRTMHADAERETGPVWATKDDPRRTRVGAWLRRLSFDEVPQLINILFGHMSLVGPRPERPHFVEQFSQTIPKYMRRHREKAGLTGWAAVNGLRGDTSIEERTRYDLYYVENWSILFDLRILVKTLLILFRDRNAY